MSMSEDGWIILFADVLAFGCLAYNLYVLDGWQQRIETVVKAAIILASFFFLCAVATGWRWGDGW